MLGGWLSDFSLVDAGLVLVVFRFVAGPLPRPTLRVLIPWLFFLAPQCDILQGGVEAFEPNTERQCSVFGCLKRQTADFYSRHFLSHNHS